MLRFVRHAAHLRDRRHRLRRQERHPRARQPRLPGSLPRPSGLGARPQGLRVHRPRPRATCCSRTGSSPAWRAAPPSCTWSASSASTARAASPSSRLHVRATENMLAVAQGGRREALPADERARHAAGRPLRLSPHEVGGRGGRPRERRSTGRSSGRPSSSGAATSSSPCWRPWSAATRWCPCSATGSYRLQPIAVEQVAEGFVRALRNAARASGRPTTWPVPSPTASWRSSTRSARRWVAPRCARSTCRSAR